MPDFTRVINLAYQRILERPADPGGLENYNQLMNGGMTEAAMRESLLRSPEYAQKHPGSGPTSRTETTLSSSSSTRAKKKKPPSARKKKSTRAR